MTNFKPKQTRFIQCLIDTGAPATASYDDLLTAANHGGWTCIPAWVRTDADRKVGRGLWDISDLIGTDTGNVPTVQPRSKASVAPKSSEPVQSAVPVGSVPTAEANFALAMTGGEQESLVPSKISTYVPWGHFEDIEQIVGSTMFYPVFLTGLSGNGKTTMVDQVCAKMKRECFRVNITAQTDEDDLLGGFRLINGDTVWQDGPVVQAMKRGAILLIDEIDLAGPAIMCLQPVMEGKGVFLKKINTFVKPAEGFNVIATANTKGKGDESGKFVATNILNEAFLDRFPVTLEQDYPSKSTEKKIVMKVMKSLGAADSEFASCLTRWSNDIRTCYMQDAVDEIVTTRRLVNIATAYSIFGCRRKAVEMATARFDDATKESFISMYEKIDASIRPEEEQESAAPEIQTLEPITDEMVLDLTTTYEQKDAVKADGARWNAGRKTWQITGLQYNTNPDGWQQYSPTVAPTDAPF